MNEALPTGNRQSETRNAGTMPYVYSPTGSNRLFQTGSTSRYHTATGNTQSIGTTSFAYDGFNRLATSQTAAETTTYTYNALGERIRKANQFGLSTVFHYGTNGELLYERDQAGNTKEYVWLDGRPIARIDNQTSIYYYHVDHLGTPQAMTDATGATVWQADYEPFGKATVKTSTIENNLRFPGQYFDRETGMHYNYFRDYDPSTGRYVQSDPIGLEGGLNTYAYVGNNPLSYIDPYGLWAIGDPLPQGLVDATAGFGDALSFGFTDWVRDQMGTNDAVDKCSGAYTGGTYAGYGWGAGLAGAGLYRGYQLGWELSLGRNFRIAPFGNRTGHPTGRFPHYHRRGVDPATGQTRPGQGIGRHRPWDTRGTDRSFGDRF